ncbi:palmitoyltransferase ZDHHC20-B-like [Rhipicephalus microplus]|uniref:palmitoyltransferase ZDHHC20-B-like n=1 Tax=Rhipicephalus microplus TaxID=6941 RepID=UPI003F6ADB46
MLPSVDQPVTLIEDGSNVRRGSFTKPRPLAWLPVLLVSALISCAYYAYVLVFCRLIVAEESTAKAVTFGTGFHLLLSMCIWGVVREDDSDDDSRRSTSVPVKRGPGAGSANCQNERTRHGLLEMLASQKGMFTRGPGGSARYCVLCHLLKPDRCHHCSTCRRCIMKMGHHCPWFNNCVCFSTYKFFLLILFYTVALCLYGLATLTAHLVEWWSYAWLRKPYAFHVGFLLVLGTMLAVTLGSFLVMHLFMVSKNGTTIERLRDATFQELGDSFDLGNRYENFVEVLGPRKSLWMIPVFTSLGDGVRFPTRLHPRETRSSLGHLPSW